MKYTKDNIIGKEFSTDGSKKARYRVVNETHILKINRETIKFTQFSGNKRTIEESVQSWVDGGYWFPVDEELENYEIY